MEDIVKTLRLKRAEAAEMIRKAPAGTKFAMHVSCDLIDEVSGNYSQFGGLTYVDLSRKEAISIVDRISSDASEARGQRIPLTVKTHAAPVGSKTGKRSTYWLG
jgi:hypothetical protein